MGHVVWGLADGAAADRGAKASRRGYDSAGVATL